MVKFSAFGTSHIQRLFLFYFKLHWLIYTLIFSETCQPAKRTCFNINVNSQTPVDCSQDVLVTFTSAAAKMSDKFIGKIIGKTD